MKKNKFLPRLVISLTIIMGGLTVLLLFAQGQQNKNNTYITIDSETMKLIQLDPPKENDTIAIVDTTLGEFRFVLYEEKSPNAVKNFIELAESGYYDNTYVYNSVDGAYFSAGSKLKTGGFSEGYDKARELVERELDQDLWPFKGAVCSMNTTIDRTFKQKLLGGGKYFNGSRFSVLNTIEFDDETKQELLDASKNKDLGQAFIDMGGIPNFSQQFTIIGQTYEGLDVVEKLSSLDVESNGEYYIPNEDIMINSVTISTYSNNDSEK